MAINREAAREEMERSKSERGGSGVNFVGKGTFLLRVLEFTDADGVTRFARKVVKWGKQVGAKRKDVSVHRRATFGEDVPDAIEKLEELMGEQGQESPYTARKQYYVNAIDLNEKIKKVERWALPSSIWEDITAVALNDQWSDVLEAENGHAFSIVGTGDGLERQYTTTVERNGWPVPAELMSQVIDPLSAVRDPGLEGQAALVGTTVADLYGDGAELENVDSMTVEEEEAPAPPPPARQAPPPARGAVPQRTAPSAAPAARSGPPPVRPPSTGVSAAPVAPVAAPNKPVAGRGLIRGLARPAS
jgi:hypothetical protein